jgi:hypothetical protein
MIAFLYSDKIQEYIAQGHFEQLLLEYHWDPDSRYSAERIHAVLCSMKLTIAAILELRILAMPYWCKGKHSSPRADHLGCELLRAAQARVFSLGWTFCTQRQLMNCMQCMHRVLDLGFKPWRVNRHEGSDCCLDVRLVSELPYSLEPVWTRCAGYLMLLTVRCPSYVWKKKAGSNP